MRMIFVCYACMHTDQMSWSLRAFFMFLVFLTLPFALTLTLLFGFLFLLFPVFLLFFPVRMIGNKVMSSKGFPF